MPTASTRRCSPAWTRLVATSPVAPPTEPAVCTRSSGLPMAPSASARYSSGIITPSNRSGAFPTTTASMSARSVPASARARSTASRHSPAIDTSVRRDRWRVWPTPSTAARASLRVVTHRASITQTRFCCRAGPLVAWPRARSAWPDMICAGRHPDPGQPGGEHRVAAQRPARRVDPDVVPQAQRAAQQDLLVRERRVQLGHVHPPRQRRFPPRAPRWPPTEPWSGRARPARPSRSGARSR